MTDAPLALLTPMANPTIEREMRRLVPDCCDYVVGRLVSRLDDSRERLISYAEDLGQSLAQFGGLPLSAIAFACTASSYLIGLEREDSLAKQVGIPVLWAAATIREELSRRGARRLAVVSPYPDAIHQAGLAYWSSAGFVTIFDERVEIGSDDTRSIYAQPGAKPRLRSFGRARPLPTLSCFPAPACRHWRCSICRECRRSFHPIIASHRP